MELYLERSYDELQKDGSRESDKLFILISKLYPDAVWRKENDDAWSILV